MIAATASSIGITSASAKKHGCITVLIFPGMPSSRAMRAASIENTVRSRSMISRWIDAGRFSQTSSAGYGALRRNVPPRTAVSRTGKRSSNPNW
ncbi:MAG: hypothetical protein AAGD33_21710 [Actinomycetota bacterium]